MKRLKIKKAADPLKAAKQRLRELRLRAPTRPVNDDGTALNPQLPPDLTALNDVEIGRLHSQFACMAQYAITRLAIMAVETAVAKKEEKFVRAKVRTEKSGTVADKDMKVDLDRRTRSAGHHTLVGESTEGLTRAVLEGFLIGRDATSREMTRRHRTDWGNRT